MNGLNAIIQSSPLVKFVISVLSLESEDDIEVSWQNKFWTASLPRTTLLLPVVMLPDGLLDLPASWPRRVLLSPVVTLCPASGPTPVLYLL